MSWSDIEMQAVQALLGVLVGVLTGGIMYLAQHAKASLKAHASAKYAEQGNHIIDGLDKIAESTVQALYQRVVSDAQKNGLFTPELLQSVKQDAIDTIKQSLPLVISPVSQAIAGTDPLILSLVDKYLDKYGIKVQTPTA